MRHENRYKIVQIYEVMDRKIRPGSILYLFTQLFATSVHFLFEKFAAMTLLFTCRILKPAQIRAPL